MPNTNDPAYKKWDAKNVMVMSWLLHSMQPNIANNYLFLSTAKAIWDLVKKASKAGLYDFHQKGISLWLHITPLFEAYKKRLTSTRVLKLNVLKM